MGVVIKMKTSFNVESKHNIKQLKALIDKYLPEQRTFLINKIKKEQQ